MCLCALGLAALLDSGASPASAVESYPGQGFLPDNRAWEMVSPPDKNGGILQVRRLTRELPLTAARSASCPVIVREGLVLDPRTAEVHVDGAASDPIPHLLKGIPLKLRDLRIYVDRLDFAVNPTSCDPAAVGATLFGSFVDVLNSADDLAVTSVPVTRPPTAPASA